MSSSGILPDGHFLTPHWELIHDTPFLEHGTLGHVCPSADDGVGVLFRIVSLHLPNFLQELRGKVLNVVEVSGMDVEDIWMGGNLYLYAVNPHQLMSVLDETLVNPVVRVCRVHYDDDSVLDSLLTDRKHDGLELFLGYPFLRFINNECGYTVNGFQLGRLHTR